MDTPPTGAVLEALCRLGLLGQPQLDEITATLAATCAGSEDLTHELVRREWLTEYQAEQLLRGRGADLVLGPYLLLGPLGRGGMGEVFKARHRGLDRLVALKFIRKEHLEHADVVKRFQREARAAAQLSHPNVVLLYHLDQVGDTYFLVMEYLEGKNLARLVHDGGPLPAGRACAYVRQAALGLQHVFERGLVHRDVKPGNLFLVSPGATVKLLDLGLALLSGACGAEAFEPLTGSGMVIGTRDYMAPEQARDARSVDIRADVYSLGCTLYFLLTGMPPFPGGLSPARAERACPPLRVAAPAAPPGLEPVLHRALAARPEDRYQTPAELAAALSPFCTPDDAPAAVTGMPSTVGESDPEHAGVSTKRRGASSTRTFVRRPRLRVAAVAGVVALAAAAVCWWLFSDARQAPPGPDVRPPARFVVGGAAGPGEVAFPTVRAALAEARPGDRVLVAAEVLRERLALTDGLGKGVLLEAAAPSGRPVVWRPPGPLPDATPVLEVAAVEGLTVKGFILDGEGRVDDLVLLSGHCPGLRLHDVHLRGFRRSAVRVRNAAGAAGRPVLLERLRTTATGPVAAAIAFESRPDLLLQVNEHIEVREGRFEGPYEAFVEVAGPVAGVRFFRNRFFKAANGFVYRSTAIDPRHRIDLTLEANTFCEVKGAALHLEALALAAADSRLAVTGNLFARTAVLARTEPAPVEPQGAAEWIWCRKDNPLVPPKGDECFRTDFVDTRVIASARVDVFCDQRVTVWWNGVRVGEGKPGLRVHTFDVTTPVRSKRGATHILAVQCADRPGRNGMMAQLVYRGQLGGVEVRGTGPSWLASRGAPDGWPQLAFEVGKWPRAVSRKVTLLKVTSAVGNVCDLGGKEGSLPLQANAINFTLPQDPSDGDRFLRYPQASPLARAGPGQQPVGVLPEK